MVDATEATASDLKVLHVSTERGWRGGERQVLLLLGALRTRGAMISLAAPAASPLASRATAAGIPSAPLHHRRPYHPINVLRLAGWLRCHRDWLVHSHTSPALTLAAFAGRLVGRSGLVHTRRVVFPVRRSQKYSAAADRYVAVSRAVHDQLLSAGAPASRVRVIHSAVDLELTDTFTPAPALDRRRPGPTVACVAHFSPEKGHATLLTAWAEVARSQPAARLVLVGDGPERPWIESIAAGIPQGEVVFTGFSNDVAAWLKGSDVYVQPSLSEGIGSAVLEAMACRLPVVASRVGGLPEAVRDRETGLLVAPERPRELAAAVLSLIGDPERATAMGAAGRRRVEEHFTVARMVEEYVGVYRGLGDS